MEYSVSNNSFFFTDEPKKKERKHPINITNGLVYGAITLMNIIPSVHTPLEPQIDQFTNYTINSLESSDNNKKFDVDNSESYNPKRINNNDIMDLYEDTTLLSKEVIPMDRLERVEDKLDNFKDDMNEKQTKMLISLNAIEKTLESLQKSQDDLPNTVENIVLKVQKQTKDKWYERLIAPFVVAVVSGVIVGVIVALIVK